MVKLDSIQKGDKRLNLLIIEPHADDALLSTYSLITQDLFDFDILTCCNHKDGRSSKDLARYFTNLSKVKILHLSESNYLWDNKGYNYSDVYHFKRSINAYDHLLDLVKSTKSFISDLVEIELGISQLIKNNHYDYVLAPFGLMHPYHILVAEACKEVIPCIFLNFYFELNHYNMKSVQDRLIKKGGLLDSRITELKSEPFVKFDYNHKAKYDIFKEVYPSELKLTLGDYSGHMLGETFLLSNELKRRLGILNE